MNRFTKEIESPREILDRFQALPKSVMHPDKRVSLSRIHCSIRSLTGRESVALRCQFGRVLQAGREHLLWFTDMKEEGLERLTKFTDGFTVSLSFQEAVMTFVARLERPYENGFLCKIPSRVSVLNRRKEKRHKMPQEFHAFFAPDPKVFRYEHDALTAPPFFGLYQQIATWQRISDISVHGFQLENQFLGFYDWMLEHGREGQALHGQIIMPGLPRIPVSIQKTWEKRTRSRDENGVVKNFEGQRMCHMGFSIHYLQEEHKEFLTQYLSKQLLVKV